MKKEDEISSAILTTVNERGVDKSTCPSEIARMLYPNNWRKQMAAVRDVAIILERQGKVRITQKGLPIDTSAIRGPIRITINRSDPS